MGGFARHHDEQFAHRSPRKQKNRASVSLTHNIIRISITTQGEGLRLYDYADKHS